MLNEFFNGSTGETGYTIQRSLRFNSADSSYLSRTPSSEGNRKTWTWSGWVKRCSFGSQQMFMDHGNASTISTDFGFNSSDNIYFTNYNNAFQSQVRTDAVFRDPSSWYHIVIAIDTTQATEGNRVKIYVNGTQQDLTSVDGYPTQNFDTYANTTSYGCTLGARSGGTFGSNAYYADVHFIDGQALAPTDFGEFDANGVWNPIAYSGSYGTNGFRLDFSDNSSNAALGYDAAGSNDWTVNNLSALSDAYTASSYRENTGATSQTWNDSNAASATSSSLDEDEIFWVDLGSTVSTDLIKFDVTITGTDTNANNYSVYYTTDPASVGSNTFSSFSRSAGGTTGSFTMTLSGSSAISGRYFGIVNGNGGTSATFVYSNFQVYPVTKECDSLLDSPTNYDDGTNVGGNYATLNPLVNSSYASLSDGNLKLSTPSTGRGTSFSTIAVSSGKFYCEIEFDSGSSASARIGVIRSDTDYAETDNFTGETNAIGYLSSGAIVEAGVTLSTQPSTYSTGDIVGIALNMDDGEIEFFENGVSQGTYNRSILDSGSYYFAVADSSNSAGATFIANFGQRPFAYTPPTGYVSLCTTNLPDPSIADGSTAMDIVTYIGDNGTNRAITGLNMSPDFVWIKQRSDAGAHMLFDAVRGATKRLVSNQTIVEAAVQGVISFDSNGFTLGNDPDCNFSPRTHVAWTWDAGDSNTTITAGSLNSSVYDQSQTWSNNLTSNQPFGLAETRAFDGNLSTLAATLNDPSANLLFTKTFTNVTKLRVYMDHDLTYRVRINGGTWHTDSSLGATSNASWRDLTSIIPGDGIVNSIESDTGGQNNGINWSAVEVNGRLLIDSGVTVTDFPSVTSTVRANPSAGFSIVSYDGGNQAETVGHGLNAAPELIIAKARNAALGWKIYHSALGVGGFLEFDTDAFVSVPNYWGSSITSSTFGISAGGDIAVDGMIAYCFAPVEGYSAFGSYQGNGSSDGPMVYTGFRPAFLLVKASSAAENWNIFDDKRSSSSGSNVIDYSLSPNLSNAEYQLEPGMDFVSNGFKSRNSVNTNGVTYVWAAFASHPFKTARAR